MLRVGNHRGGNWFFSLFRYDLLVGQSQLYGCTTDLKQLLLVIIFEFHLGRMDIDIAFFLWQIQIQHGKWKFVLHYKGTVTFFNRAVYDVAFNVPVIDKIIFKSTVSSCDKRLADKSRQMNITVSVINWNQIGSDISAV